ncbi:MAG: lysine-2,3-aminomutase-like protein [Paracoccaceae bacterium]
MTVAPPTTPKALTTLSALKAAGLVAQDAGLEDVAETFRIRLSPAMRGAIANPDDPVARQFLPTAAERSIGPEELHDPIGDRTHEIAPGLTHRYPDRAILAVTQACEVYCRFCFRRETVGASGPLPETQLAQALDAIARTPAIREIILTGGDPFSLSSRRIADIVTRLAAIKHVEVLRVHTRVPVVAPDRITTALVDALNLHPAPWVVIHTNHAQELTPAALEALSRLNRAGIPLLSQTVLLRGVNDSADALETLFRALIRARVKPYYLHHCDLARGAGHFRTTIAEGQAIMAELKRRLSGTALPTYVLDIPGGHGKVPIGPAYLEATRAGWNVTDPNGNRHSYQDPQR